MTWWDRHEMRTTEPQSTRGRRVLLSVRRPEAQDSRYSIDVTGGSKIIDGHRPDFREPLFFAPPGVRFLLCRPRFPPTQPYRGLTPSSAPRDTHDHAQRRVF